MVLGGGRERGETEVRSVSDSQHVTLLVPQHSEEKKPFSPSLFLQITVVGRQSGREIRPFPVQETGGELLIMQQGLRKPEEVFQHEHAQNRSLPLPAGLSKPFFKICFSTLDHRLNTLINRGSGWFCLFLGFNCASTLLDVIGEIKRNFIKIMPVS